MTLPVEYLGELTTLSTPSKVLDAISKECPCTASRYIGWLQKYDDEVLYRVFAYRTTKKYGLQYREVIRSILGEEGLIFRDMYLTYASGYKVVYKPGKNSSSSWYGYCYYSYDEKDFGRWDYTKKIGVPVNVINLDMLKDTKFKYSGYNGRGDFLEWFRTYKKYPQVEYLGKLGFEPSKKLLNKASKDKAFCKYLAKVDPNNNINAICYAYDHNMTIKEAGDYLMRKAEIGRYFRGYSYIKDSGIDLMKAKDYIWESMWGCGMYNDYIHACLALGIDLKDTKNAFPKDFKRMHDLRINQWESKKNKAKNKEFKMAADKYIQFEYQGEKYSIIIPKKVQDLVHEGTVLNHCVGKMGYDQKMINGDSFIAFVRKNDSLNKPFVTVEYGLLTKSVLQEYGKNDIPPEKEVKDFVKAWSKKVKKGLGEKKCITA